MKKKIKIITISAASSNSVYVFLYVCMYECMNVCTIGIIEVVCFAIKLTVSLPSRALASNPILAHCKLSVENQRFETVDHESDS